MDMRTVDDFHAIVVTCQYHQRQRGRCTLEGVRQNLAALRVPYSQEWITEVLNRQYSLCYNIFFTNLNAGWTADAIANSMIDGQISDPNGPFFCMETVHAVRSQYQMTTQISPHSISPLLFTPAASISFPSTYAPVDPLMTAITTQISQISITPNTTIVSPVLPPSKPSTIGPPRPTPPPTKRPSTPPSTPPPTPPTTPSVKPVVEASPSTSPAPSSGKLLLSEPSGEYFPIQPSPGEYFRTCPHHERGYCRFVNLGHQQCPEGGHSSISTQVMKATLTPLVENTAHFNQIRESFINGMKKKFAAVKVVKIVSVENKNLRSAFEARCEYLAQKRGGPPRIAQMFHGTADACVSIICDQGFSPPSDRAMTKSCRAFTGGKLSSTCLSDSTCPGCTVKHSWNTCHMYGLGSYFADIAGKSHAYVSGASGPEMKMLLCEVALGRSFEITTNLTTGSQYHDLVLPPPLPNSTQTTDSIWVPGRSDATSGLGVFTSECIIFHRYQALPRYVIHYVIS